MNRRPIQTAAILALSFAMPLASASSLPFDFKPSANLQYEWSSVDSELAASVSDDYFRRARLGFRLEDRDRRWQFVAEHDFADRTPADAYLQWNLAPGHSLRVGQFKQPFLLEDAISDKQTAMLESSFVGVFAISRRIGAEYARFGKNGTLNAAVFGQRLDGTSESPGVTLRGTHLLHGDSSNTVHVGMSLASETPDRHSASFNAPPGTAMAGLRAASTGSIGNVDRLDRAGLDGLWIHQAWSLQGEMAQVSARRDGADFTGRASSVQATWSPSGDGRSYKRGVATAPSPQGHVGWELALRWSSIDLDDGAIHGGTAESYGLAATCYLHPNARLIANALWLDDERRGVSDTPFVAGLRLQLTY
jgi:phosphate-selective porin OprO/OprP